MGEDKRNPFVEMVAQAAQAERPHPFPRDFEFVRARTLSEPNNAGLNVSVSSLLSQAQRHIASIKRVATACETLARDLQAAPGQIELQVPAFGSGDGYRLRVGERWQDLPADLGERSDEELLTLLWAAMGGR